MYVVSITGETMITFERYSATNLYRISSTSPDGDGYLAFYLLAGDAADRLSIAQTWRSAVGYYVFLKDEPSNLAAFVQALDRFFAGAAPERTGWAWLTFAAESGTVEGTVANSSGGEAVLKTEQPAYPLHDHALRLMKNAPTSVVEPVSEDIRGFTVAVPAVPSEVGSMNTPDHSYDMHISLAGPSRGCIQSKMAVSDLAEFGWDVGLYYFVQGATSIVRQYYPVLNPYPETPVMLATSFDPVDVFNPDRTYMQFTEEQAASAHKMESTSSLGDEIPLPPFVMKSKFRTTYGEEIGLKPVSAPPPPGRRGARLVVMPLAYNDRGGVTESYVAPDGDFQMVILSGKPAGEGEIRDRHLLLGLSGLESVSFREHTDSVEGSVLSFFPFSPSFVPVFPLFGAGAKQQTTDTTPLIVDQDSKGNKYETSWITVGAPLPQNGKQPVAAYFAQPDGAALYGGQSEMVNDEDILPYLAAKAALLPAPEDTTCFPAAPVTGAVPATTEFGANFVQDLEFQILSPSRRTTIQEFSADLSPESKAAEETLAYGTTPQGLLAQIGDFQWKELILASNKDSKSGEVQSLMFTNLNPTLQAAFQTNQQFLVITSDKYLKEGGTTFQDTISIEGWPFFIDVSLNEIGNYRNVLIFKFGEGSVADRVRDVRTWTDPHNFNLTEDDNLKQLSDWLVAYIEDARERAKADAAFANFVELVDNPAWNGILALNVTIGLSDFPPELKGLLAGIDLNRFSAHHFGIDVNFVQSDGGELIMEPQSSLFGLIDYVDESIDSVEGVAALKVRRNRRMVKTLASVPAASSSSDNVPPFYAQPYEFVVLTLQVVFANSEIKNFTSTIKLTINQLFGEAVSNPDSTEDPNANAIILDGIYEDHNGARSYVFNIRESKFFRFVGRVVDYVQIVKAQFSTLQSVPVPGSDGDEIVQSRFSFWGTMSFYNVADDFDLFSFDRLSYASMYVDMSFALSVPDKPVFGFNPAAMTFDPTGSVARDNSVFRNFPLQLQGVVYNGNSTGRPTDMGFMTVKTPLTGYSNSVDNTWYALSFTINLGTAGALAASIGLTAQLYAAWSPVYDPRSKNPIAVSLRLPRGGGDRNQLSLQGILQLSIKSIKFNTTIDEDTHNRAFLLLFERIALRVLGMNLPSNATIDAVLFGNPNPGSTPSSLGWYFAYNTSTNNSTAPVRIDGQQLLESEEE